MSALHKRVRAFQRFEHHLKQMAADVIVSENDRFADWILEVFLACRHKPVCLSRMVIDRADARRGWRPVGNATRDPDLAPRLAVFKAGLDHLAADAAFMLDGVSGLFDFFWAEDDRLWAVATWRLSGEVAPGRKRPALRLSSGGRPDARPAKRSAP